VSTASLELRGISKSFPTGGKPHHVLNDIDFTLMRGERLGICGLNGAGKTTLVNIIAGALMPDHGRVVRHSRMSWPLGYSGGFHSALTGLENARFIARIYGQDIHRVAAFAQDFAELGRFFEMPIRTYSSGMRSRLAFAVSMAIDFELYLIDETLSAGDIRFHEKCRRAIEERRGRSDFVIVSHSLSTIEENCNRFALLHGGRLTSYADFAAASEAYSKVFGSGGGETSWKLTTSGALDARAVDEGPDSVDVALQAKGAGTFIAYWGTATGFLATAGDHVSAECPVQLLSGSTAQILPEWSGLQFVERDRAGAATASEVAPYDFRDGLAHVATGEAIVRAAETRHFHLGLRLELGGPADLRLRIGRPFLKRETQQQAN
jgi:capsular polysaccharide transport system ATP-binding protein